jgi:hypothetical protein
LKLQRARCSRCHAALKGGSEGGDYITNGEGLPRDGGARERGTDFSQESSITKLSVVVVDVAAACNAHIDDDGDA